MTNLIRHLKVLIFNYLSFTEGLITFLSTLDSEAPAKSKASVKSVLLPNTALCKIINILQYLNTNNFSENKQICWHQIFTGSMN